MYYIIATAAIIAIELLYFFFAKKFFGRFIHIKVFC